MNENLTNLLSAKVALNPDSGKLKILVITSLLADAENKSAAADNLADAIAKSSPDLVFFDGDITKKLASADELKSVLDTVLAPVIDKNLTWAHVFGDTDRLGGLSNEDAMPVYQSYKGCISQIGPDSVDGCGNYILTVTSTENESKPVMCIYCLDSHSQVHDYEKQYGSPSPSRLGQPLYGKYYLDGIRFNQAMFYWRTSRDLEAEFGEKIPSMMLFHMPTPEFPLVVMNQGKCRMKGVQNETVRCQVVAGGIFGAALERGDVRGIFAGNSDCNNWYGVFGGVQVGQMIDFTGRNNISNGATVLEVSSDSSVSAEHIG